MKGFPKFLTIVGRVCISIIFILSGINTIIHWHITETNLTLKLIDWHTFVIERPWIADLFSFFLSWAVIFMVVAVFLELLGGILVFFGMKLRLGAFLLFLFLLLATVIYCPFWLVEGEKRKEEIVMFLQNIAILGGLLYVIALGGEKPGKKPPPPSGPPKSE